MANSVLYGLMQQKDLAANLTPQNIIINLDRELLIAVTLETIQQHNAEINALRALFSNDTTDYTLFYRGQLNNDLQEGDENSRPQAVKGVAHYSVGFPIRIATTGWGANYTTLEQMTVQDFSDRTDQMLIGDVNWHRKWTLGTLLFCGTQGTDSPYVFVDPKYGNVNVFGLANGDSVTYDRLSGLAPTTDNHYTAQNGAISDTAGQNPFPTIETALIEHPQNGTTLVSFISPTLTASIKALAGFVPWSRNILFTPGANTATFGDDAPIPLPPNARLIGVYDRTYIVEWRTVPNNLIITLATDGPKPLLYRQYMQATLQGFGPVGFSRGVFADKFPYFNEVWYRAGGWGAYDRVSAQVHQVASSTTYAMPASYAALFGL